jgi:hypothetical protein
MVTSFSTERFCLQLYNKRRRNYVKLEDGISLLFATHVQVLNKDISTDQPQSETVREFFRNLVSNHMKLSSFTSRIDFLACNSLPVDEADFIANKLHSLIGVSENCCVSMQNM